MSSVTTNRIITQYEVTGLDQLLKVADGLDKISKEERDALNELKKLNTGFKDTGKQGVQATADINKGFSGLNSTLKGVGGLLAGVFAVGQLKQFAAEIIGLTAKFEGLQKVLNFTTGSTAGGARAFQFLVETSQKLGVSLEASAAGFKTLSGAASQAGIPLAQQMKIFQDVSKAVSAFGLSGEDAKGVFLALGQIISKGTVSAEELRGQIGERIPGAFAIAARSIGVTESQLNKLLQSGKVLSKDFIVPFTAELGRVSEAAAGENGLQKNINRISNAFEILKTRIGGALLGDVSQVGSLLQKALDAANKLLETQKDRDASVSLREYNRALRESERLSKEATENAITNANAQIRALKERFDAANEKAVLDGKISKEEQKEIDTINKLITAYRGYRDGLVEASKTKQQTTQTSIALTKEQYDLELQRLQILTAIRKLEQPDKTGQLGADVAFYEAKLKLQQRFVAAGGKITKEEIDLTKAQKKKANKDLVQAELLVPMEIKKIQDIAHENTLKLDEEFDKERGKKKLDRAELYNQKEIDLEREKNEKIVMYAQASSELIATIYNGFYNIRQQQLENQLTLLQRNSDEEVRLAGDNEQRVNAIREKQRQQEIAIKTKQFKAQQQAAIANAIFQATPQIVAYAINPATVPLAIAASAILATQIAFIAAQPIPEFKEGTKGKPHKGAAVVGDGGESELMVTKSGKVSWSPAKPTLVNFREPTEVFNQTQLNEVFYGTSLSSKSKPGSKDSGVLNRLENIEKAIKGLPITQLSMDEAGFEKYIRTPKRTTQIRNNRFPTQ